MLYLFFEKLSNTNFDKWSWAPCNDLVTIYIPICLFAGKLIYFNLPFHLFSKLCPFLEIKWHNYTKTMEICSLTLWSLLNIVIRFPLIFPIEQSCKVTLPAILLEMTPFSSKWLSKSYLKGMSLSSFCLHATTFVLTQHNVFSNALLRLLSHEAVLTLESTI